MSANELVWLASYPKSGNTWFRLMIANLSDEGEGTFDINDPAERSGIASARFPFDDITLIESGLLVTSEIDVLRPRVYEIIACGEYREPVVSSRARTPPRIMKIHDAYGAAPNGEPLFAAARGAIVIVRDPRAIAPSLALHLGCTVDGAIARMRSPHFAIGVRPGGQTLQLPQNLSSWSGHVQSWLEQTDMPIFLVRYEDLKTQTVRVLREAMAFAGRKADDAGIARAVRLAGFDNLSAQEKAAGFHERSRASRSPFFRRGEADAWRSELTPEQISAIETHHGDMMSRLGYALAGNEFAAKTSMQRGSTLPLREGRNLDSRESVKTNFGEG